MKFTKHVIKDPDFPSRECAEIYWLSDNGRYKITEHFNTPDRPNRPVYHAYHRPINWNNFGNSVNRRIEYYTTIKAAKSACEIHLEENPNGACQ